MDLKLSVAIAGSKLTRVILRKFGSGATAAPGLVASFFDKSSLQKLASSYPNIILISGTNGKTTTARLIEAIFAKAGLSFIDNREGSNLVRGLTAALAAASSSTGKPASETAIFEVDEAALGAIISQLSPTTILITNLFRDQLDRYGEVETVRKLWLKAIENLDSSTNLILNADDPATASLTKTRSKIIFYGLEEEKINLGQLPHAADFIDCTNCGADLVYEKVYLSHLGHYKCPNCRLQRPTTAVSATSINLSSLAETSFTLKFKKHSTEFVSALPGLYNVYNVLAAATLALNTGINIETIKEAVREFKPAFGRTEKILSFGKEIYLSLVKNPTGFNEVIRTVFADETRKIVLIAINDLLADGRDVSWLWDVDFEKMASKTKKIFVSGIRAADMRLRLKYADIKNVEIVEDLEKALDQTLKEAAKGESVYIFPTYTAMLKLKSLLAAADLSVNFWED